ncbi:type I polyketide synthase [Streptomyces sp. Tu 2975]|uniref:type I polyketide synthase n=1 Tax=Streptomyces sp. Tu 2975 TaxID=2676871 RepID=UPI001FC98B53|nr:type I polyketide synthase [Streptomyces sp. Tu 2975]
MSVDCDAVPIATTAPEEVRDDAVAVVGVGVRLPGGIHSLDGLWAALSEGRDLIGEVPDDRFETAGLVTAGPVRPGKSCTAAGGFLEDAGSFDTGYFGISPKEAARIDPQQRLLLECAVEAFDDAAIDPARLAGSDTAVVVGVSSHDYADLQVSRPRTLNAYTMTGSAVSITANRLSHFFDLRGPSSAVDTACSSALTAVHQACEVLRSGRSPLALAGAVNVLLSPWPFAGFSQASMLSPTGRCRPFSAAADGYVRAEGAGVLLLKPLSAALADGDRVHAVIVASGVNADGRTAGLALPSARSQADLMRRVYTGAGLDAGDVAYVEAHGTGTQAGDPVECQALGEVLGSSRDGKPLPVGSVKSNLGHLEAAAGVPGLLKGMLVLREGRIPATLHAVPHNPAIDFAGLGLEPVVKERTVSGTSKALVGVNSFGFGGANAHVVLAAAPTRTGEKPRQGRGLGKRLPVIVSARTSPALTEAAHRWADHFEDLAQRQDASGGGCFYDAAFTASRRRQGLEQRIAVLAEGPEEVAAALRAVASAEPAAGAAAARAADRGRVGFVFSGNGAQWMGMGAELLGEDEAFTAEVSAVDGSLRPMLGWSVRHELAGGREQERWNRTEVAQPLLFAVQAGVVAALAARGIEPAAVMGHSVGEVAAAYCAGALSRVQACQVVAARSRAQAVTARAGRMAAVGLCPDVVSRRLAQEGFAGRLSIAAINADQDVTVAGEASALTEFGARLDDEGVFFRDLGLDYAFHTPAMDRIREPLTEALSDLLPGKCRIPFVSSVTGAAVEGTALGGGYWWSNVRKPVRFADAAAVLAGDELRCDVLVDIGPHPVLSGYLRRVAAADGSPVHVVPTLSRVHSGPAALDAAHARLLALGAQVDWSVFFPRRGAVADLPAYPWQRERHWNGQPRWWREDGMQDADTTVCRPLLGSRLPVAEPTWRRRLDPDAVPWLADHTVAGAVVWPAAAYTDMALAAGSETGSVPAEITGLVFERALSLSLSDAETAVEVSTSLAGDGALVISSRTGDQGDWRTHARGRVRRLLRERPAAVDVDAIRSRLPRTVSAQEHYDACARAGLPYGPAFQTLTGLRAGTGEVLAQYTMTMEAAAGHIAHPTVLDGALQAGMPLISAASDDVCPYLPAGVDTVRYWNPMPETGLVHVRSRSMTRQEAVWDITVSDRDGVVALELHGCRIRRFEAGRPARPQQLTETLRAAPLLGQAGAPSPLPAPPQVFAARAQELASLTAAWQAGPYDRFRARGLEVAAHFVGAAVRELLPGADTVTVEGLVAAGAHAKHIRLLNHLLGMAARHGVLQPAGPGRWRAGKEPTPGPLFAAMLDDFPGEALSGLLYGIFGKHLVGVLRGHVDPLELLFSEADALAGRFYDGAPVLAHHGRLAATLLAAAVAEWPKDRPLRILEVGAGTGSTTAALLPHLRPGLTTCTFTDVSSAFFPQARSRFAAYDFVDYQVLDLESDPSGQGFTSSSFDIVVASNVLHATTDLRATLRRVADLLADDGHLLAVESHSLDLLAPLFGLLDTFWSTTDHDLRPDGPLMGRDQWKDLLNRSGFTGATSTGGPAPFSLADHSVIVAARRPRATEESTAFLPTATNAAGGRRWVMGTLPGPGTGQARLQHALRSCLGRRTEADSVTIVSLRDPSWVDALRAQGQPPTDLVLLVEEASTSPAEVTDAAVRHLAVLRELATACTQPEGSGELTVWLVHSSPHEINSPPPAVDIAGAWGGARTLASEHRSLTVRRIALTGARHLEDFERLAERLTQEMLAGAEDDEVVLTPSGRFTTVVRPLAPPVRPSGNSGYTLTLDDVGLHYRLGWQAAEPPVPGAGEVVISVAAAALNYRDIMVATGRVPAVASGRLPDRAGIGLECAGVICAVGPGVTHLAPGDRVAAPARGAFGTHALARADRVMPLPADMTFAEGSTLPVALGTVHHSLHHLARLTKGETLLIHGAAGAVGMAALQHARRVGADVIATAGTPVKRDLLGLLGVKHVLDSRRLDFAEQVKDLTGGAGVDVVLNSLAGEALVRGVGLLKPHGRFIELGMRDFLLDSPLPLAPFVRNLSFFGVDLSPMLNGSSPLMDAHLAELGEAVRRGDYKALPHRVYPAHRIAEAFSSLQHSRHFGKVVVAFGEEEVSLRPAALRPALDPQATYLITGGLSGLGAATARHLAHRGARHLTLLSRRGDAAPEAASLLADLHRAGTDATVHAADVSDEAALREVLQGIDDSGRRLAGVVHAAMVLDDGALPDLSDERLRAVLAPKTTAGMLLHSITRNRPLDLFVMYSSVAALAGNMRQAPYVGGNLALEALARGRHRAGLPALAVQWGSISGTGYVHRSGRGAEMAAIGLGHLTAGEALACLDELLERGDVPNATVGFFDWDLLRQHVMPSLSAPRTAGLLQGREEREAADHWRATLAAAGPAEATRLIEDKLAELLAMVLQSEPDRIDRSRRLELLGLDSLMALELSTALGESTGCDLPVVELIGAGSLTELARHVAARLGQPQH